MVDPEQTWEAALAEHHRTGDYVPLGIWAQDNVPKLFRGLDDVISLNSAQAVWVAELRVALDLFVNQPELVEPDDYIRARKEFFESPDGRIIAYPEGARDGSL